MTFAIIWDGMQATRPVGARATEPVRWVPMERMGTAEAVERREAKVELCTCGTMKPAGARYHAAMLRERDDMLCAHGQVFWSACTGRVPPPCCWETT